MLAEKLREQTGASDVQVELGYTAEPAAPSLEIAAVLAKRPQREGGGRVGSGCEDADDVRDGATALDGNGDGRERQCLEGGAGHDRRLVGFW